MSHDDVDLDDVFRALDSGQTRIDQLSERVGQALTARLGLDPDAIQAHFDGRVKRERNAPRLGGPAPDFELELFDALGSRSTQTRQAVRPSGQARRSDLWLLHLTPFSRGGRAPQSNLRAISRAESTSSAYTYRKRIPMTGWQRPANLADAIVFDQPRDDGGKGQRRSNMHAPP